MNLRVYELNFLNYLYDNLKPNPEMKNNSLFDLSMKDILEINGMIDKNKPLSKGDIDKYLELSKYTEIMLDTLRSKMIIKVNENYCIKYKDYFRIVDEDERTKIRRIILKLYEDIGITDKYELFNKDNNKLFNKLLLKAVNKIFGWTGCFLVYQILVDKKILKSTIDEMNDTNYIDNLN